MGATCAYTALRSPKYRSEAKLYVRLGREAAAVDPMATSGDVGAGSDPRVFEINAILDLLSSYELRREVVDKLGSDRILAKDGKSGLDLEGTFAFLNEFHLNPFQSHDAGEDAAKQLADQVKTATTKTSSVITVACEARSPELAQDILKQLIQATQDRHVRVKETRGSQNFFADQVKLSRSQLGDAEQQLRDFRTKSGLMDFALQHKIAREQIAVLDNELRTTDALLANAKAEVAVCQKMLTSTPRMHVVEEVIGQPSTARDVMRSQLYALQLKEKEIRSHYQGDTFFVKQIADAIAQAEDTLKHEPDKKQVKEGTNAVYDLLAARLSQQQVTADSLDAKSAKLREQLAEAQKEPIRLAQCQAQLADLERTVALAEDRYRTYSRSQEQIRVDGAMELGKLSNINVLQSPTLLLTPVRPNPRLNLMFGSLLAIVAAGLVFVRRPSVVAAVPIIDAIGERPSVSRPAPEPVMAHSSHRPR